MFTRKILLDTTFLLPSYGVSIDVDEKEIIANVMQGFIDLGGEIYVSTLSLLEAFLKTYRVAEKLKNEEGKIRAREGFISVMHSNMIRKIDFLNYEIFLEAFKIRKTNKDPFDCFIFATSKAKGIPLLTEDSKAAAHLGEELICNWEKFKNNVFKKENGSSASSN